MSLLRSLFDRRGWKTMVSETLGKGSPKLPELTKGLSREINQTWLEDFIYDFVRNDSGNRLEQAFSSEPIYQAPLIGFVRGTDPLFQEYKKINNTALIKGQANHPTLMTQAPTRART